MSMKINDKTTISLRQLREHFPEYIAAVNQGKSFTVLKRSKPVFQISPVADEGEWETVVDFTDVAKDGVPIDDVLRELEA